METRHAKSPKTTFTKNKYKTLIEYNLLLIGGICTQAVVMLYQNGELTFHFWNILFILLFATLVMLFKSD
jgi:hypothetical protein